MYISLVAFTPLGLWRTKGSLRRGYGYQCPSLLYVGFGETGRVPERSNGTAWKAVARKGLVGSNPTPSADWTQVAHQERLCSYLMR